MSNSSNDEKSDVIIVLDKSGNILFNSTNVENIQVVKDADINNLINLSDRRLSKKGKHDDINSIINTKELGHILIFRNKETKLMDNLLKYKNIETGLYSKELIEDIKEGIIELDSLKSYSIIGIEINSIQDSEYNDTKAMDEQKIIDIGNQIVSNIREQDIPIRFDNNGFFIIIPIADKKLLDNIKKRIEKVIDAVATPNYEISIAVVSSDTSTKTIDLINKLEQLIDEEKRKKGYIRFEQEVNINDRIAKVRQKLNSMINNSKGYLLDDEIIEMSQYLDRLIVAYMKSIRSDGNDG